MIPRTSLYVGCYTNETSTGIRTFDAAASGELTEISTLSSIENPSFLAPHPHLSVLYAVSETSNGRGNGGSVFALEIDGSDGSLIPTQEVPSGGDAPCYLSVDAEGSFLYVANYASGTVAALRLHGDGRIGDPVAVRHHQGSGPTDRQTSPHVHCAVPHFSRPGFVAVDLGLDQVINYAADLTPEQQLELAPGSGPRHLAWHPDRPVGFVVGELDNTITVVEVDPATGRLSAICTSSTLPPLFDGFSLAAEVCVDRGGNFVYVSNRGHDSIAVFAFTEKRLELQAIVPSGGESPRSFAVHPEGGALIVANQLSNSLIPFGIDPHTGIPAQLDLGYEASNPVFVTFVEHAL